jgi:DNA-binding transcriptional MerR regulator/effector-binding domain-containing protein
LGLIEPAHTDMSTGYRYYTAAQLPKLNRILVLKDLGFTLEQITVALRENLPAAELRGMLMLKRTEVEQSIDAETQRLRQIESRIAQIETEGKLVADDVVLRDEASRLFLSIRQVVASFAEGLQLVGKLAQLVPRVVGNGTLGQFAVIAHAPEFEPDNLDVEMGFYLQRQIDASVTLADGTSLSLREVPAAKLATCVRVGPPQQSHLATAKIARFVEANGYRIVGTSREVFLQRPVVERMHEAVVEMQFPIQY